MAAATAALVQAGALVGNASAATGTWNGSADTSWANAANWTGGVPNATADDAVFNTAGAINLNVLANTGTFTVRTLQFNANATSPVTIAVGANNGTLATAQFIVNGQPGDDIIVAAGNHVISGVGTTSFSDMRVGAGAGAAEGFTFNIADNSSLTINARLFQQNSANQYHKTGNGTLTLGMNNGGGGGWNFTGGTFSVDAGVLVLGNNGATGNSGNKFTVNGGATLELQANYGSTGSLLTLNGGTLRSRGANRSIGAAANGSVALTAAGGTIDVVDNSLTLTQDITGAGGFNKVGAGTLVLNDGGANVASTFTGPVTISTGTVALGAAGSVGSSSLVNVQSGAALNVSANTAFTVQNGLTLGGAGTVYGNASLSTNGAIAPGLVGTVGTLAFANNLNLTGGRVNFDLTNNPAGANDLVAVAGNLSLTNSTRFAINRLNGALGAGTYTLMNYTGTLTGDATNIALPTVRQGLSIVDPTTTPNQIQVSVGNGSAANLTWVGDGAANAWNVNGAPNWSGAADQKFFDWDDVTFNDGGSNSPQVDIQGTLAPNSVTVANSAAKSYTFGGSGTLTNVNSLTKTGTGVATFANAGGNQFASVTVGGHFPNSDGILAFATADNIGSLTVLSSGTALFASGATGTTGNVLVAANGALVIANGNQSTFGPTQVNDGGGVFVNGAGTFTSLTINGGASVAIGDGVTAGAGSVAGAVEDDGVVILNRPDNFTFSTVMSSSGGFGTIQKLGAASAATFSANNSAYTGDVLISAGTVVVNSSNSLGSTAGGHVFVTSGAALDLSGNTANNGLNFGAKQFFIAGDGVGNGGAILNNGTQQQNALQHVTLSDNASIGGSQRFDIRSVPTGSLNASLDLAGKTLTKNSTGQFTLVGADVTDGNIVVNAGTFGIETVSNIPDFGTGKTITYKAGTSGGFFNLSGPVKRPMVIDGEGVTFGTSSATASLVGSNVTLKGNLAFGSFATAAGNLTMAGVISDDGTPRSITKTAAGANNTVVLAGNNAYTGLTQIDGGTLQIGAGSTTGSLGAGSVTNNANLAFNRSDTLTVNNAIAGTGALHQNGAGTTVLAAANTYTGATNVNAGHLVIGNGDAVATSSGLNVGSLGTAHVGTSLPKAVKVSALTNAGTVDMSNGKLVIDYAAGNSPVATIRSQLVSGYAAGSWNGVGINTSAPVNVGGHVRAVGYAEATEAGVANTTWNGQPVDADAVLTRYTLAGDGDLNGTVDLTDFTFLAGHFNQIGGASWINGDYNYDGNVDLTDFTFLAGNFNQTLPADAAPAAQAQSLGSVVPEPASFSVLALAIAGGLLGRRNRRVR